MGNKNRTNWSDKARRITGGVTLAIVVLIIILCVSLGKKDKTPESQVTVQPSPVVTEVKSEEKKPEPVVKEETPIVEETVVEEVKEPVAPVIEEPVKDIVVENEPEYTTGSASFEVCGVTVLNSWADGVFVSTSTEKDNFSVDAVMDFVRYEADKYVSLMDEETVMKITANVGTIKIEYPPFIDPEILMPYYKSDIEEYVAFITPIEVEPEVIEEPIVEEIVDEEIVIEEPVPEPIVEEVIPETVDFEVFGYTVNNSWIPGTLTSTSATKGLLTEADIRGFVLYEVEKYGDLLMLNTAVEFIPDGFVITYPETEDARAYLPTYKADIEEYVAKLFALVEEPVVEEIVEEVVPKTADFEVFGYTVNNSWITGTLTSTSATKGLLSEADVRGFMLYEVEKYGDLLMLNTAVEFIPDGFVLTYPETEDARAYLPTYKADIEEYVAKLFAPVEEPVVEELAPEPVVEEVIPETADFTVFGYTVNNSWIPGTLTSTSATKGLLSEADVRGFVLYEVEKYGDLLMLNTAVEFIPDGFVLTYPETEDVRAYLPIYKADIEEYVTKLFAPVEEPVVEEVVPETADFEVFGYTVNNSWIPGTLTSTSATKGLLSEADVRGFVLYEVEKYGDLLMLNTAIEFIPDGFVLTYPETEDARAYLPTYKADIEEYVAKLFATVEEPVTEEVVEEPVVEEVVPETADFTVFGYTVNNSWIPGTLTSTSATKGLLSEADVRGFVLYEVEKYGDLLMLNTAIEFIPDGFVLTYPETEDVRAYLPTYKADIEEYVAKLFAPVEEPVVEEVVEPEVEVVEEPIVPEPVSHIIVTVVTDGVKVAQPEGMVSPAAEKVSKFDVSLSAGADFGFKTGRSYNPTIFPSFSVAGEFRNMFNLGPIGIGSRFDASFIFRPLDGTFIGHDFGFFLNGNNWAVDGTLDAKIMFSLDWEKTRAYLGFGIGYSLASNVSGITSHTGTQVFGFNSAVVATGVLGVQWKLGDTFFLSLEGQGRYFFQSKEYGVGAAVRMGWSF